MLYIWPLDLLHLQKGKVWGAYRFVRKLKTSCLLGSLRCNAHKRRELLFLRARVSPSAAHPSVLKGPAAMWALGMDSPQLYSMSLKIAF